MRIIFVIHHTFNMKILLASWILKTSLDLIKTKRKKGLKIFLTDWIFQKLKLKFFLLHKSENIMLLYWFKHTSDAHRRFSFRIYYTFAKIIGVSYTQIAAEGCW